MFIFFIMLLYYKYNRNRKCVIFIKKYVYIIMKKIITLTEGDIHRIVQESVKRILSEGKIETWAPDEFVTWDEYQDYCNHSNDWLLQNMERCDKLGIPQDERCDFCQKPLKGPHKILYGCDDHNDVKYYAHPNKNHNDLARVGKTCAKAFEKAHKDKYGY